MSRGRSWTTGRAEQGSVAKPASRSDRSTQASGERPATDALSGIEPDLDFDPAELREFLAGDLFDVEADPVFKERLRQKLWRLVRIRYGSGSDED